jgi:hypothetical protein
MRRCSVLWVLVVLSVLALAAPGPAAAQDGAWAGSAGLLISGDPDEPLTGDGGFELSAWRVLAERWDVGVRLNQLEFSSEGLAFTEAPSFPTADADVTSAEVVARWYPTGSDALLFPWISFGVMVPVSDNFDAATQFVGDPSLGIVEGATWEVDGVGFSVEGGARFDMPGGGWYLEGGARYMVLGAETTAFVSVEGAPPGAEQTRTLATDLDTFVASLTVGFYF